MYPSIGKAEVKQGEEIAHLERKAERKAVYIIKEKIKIG